MTSETNPAFLASEGGSFDCREARVHVIPVPFERTVSYGGGTAAGPGAILRASQQLEIYDGVEVPLEHGIGTQPAIDVAGDAEGVLARVAEAAAASVAAGALPVILGGEHTVSCGAVAGIRRRQSIGVLQFDAHADLRDTYEGTRWSHACAMRRVLEEGCALAQFGVRALSPEDLALRRAHNLHALDAKELSTRPLPDRLLPEGFPRDVYVTIDVDVLDPAAMPATGTPEPGGLDWYVLMELLERVLAGRRVVGCDVVELAPIPGWHAADFTAARLVYNLIGFALRSRSEG